MKDEVKKKRLGQMFWTLVKDRIGGDRQHGWGIEDSMHVVEQLTAEDLPDGLVLSEECLALLRLTINQSAMRQQLESPRVNLLDKSEKATKRTSSLADIAAEFE